MNYGADLILRTQGNMGHPDNLITGTRIYDRL